MLNFSDFRDFVCSLFPKAILLDFYSKNLSLSLSLTNIGFVVNRSFVHTVNKFLLIGDGLHISIMLAVLCHSCLYMYVCLFVSYY